MRTDSTTLSESAVAAARQPRSPSATGADYVPTQPRVYTEKVKNAQEAHEAIRPAGDRFRTPDQVAPARSGESDEARLYELIWKRTVASQMTDAIGRERLGAPRRHRRRRAGPVEFAATGKTITFPGFLRAYVEGATTPTPTSTTRSGRCPPLADRRPAAAERDSRPRGHETKPPARYTEASLVKRLEELGVGRPSTYASIITHDPGPRLRVEEGLGAGARLHRLRRRDAARGHFPTWSTTSSPPAWRTTSTTSPAGEKEACRG